MCGQLLASSASHPSLPPSLTHVVQTAEDVSHLMHMHDRRWSIPIPIANPDYGDVTIAIKSGVFILLNSLFLSEGETTICE